VGLAAAFFAVYYLVYGAAALLADRFTERHQWFFNWETQLPLVPWTAWIYLSLNFMVIPMLLVFPTVKQLRPVIVTLAVELLLAAVSFCLVPLEGGFQDPPAQGVLALAETVALRHNYFPSLHVALAWTGAFTIGGPLMVLWATLISLSTLTVHQHHLVDVAGGFALAWAGYRFVYRRLACAAP
jgi:membrane-associated phospholipid phosphatase